MSKDVGIASYDEEREPLKKRPLIADIWEDLKIREAIAAGGGDEDTSGRIHSHVDKDSGRRKVLFAGKPGLSKEIKEAIKSDEVDLEEVEIENYPGDENFDKQKAQDILRPRLFRTLRDIREDLGLLEMPILEQGAIKVEETIERGFDQLLGKDKS